MPLSSVPPEGVLGRPPQTVVCCVCMCGCVSRTSPSTSARLVKTAAEVRVRPTHGVKMLCHAMPSMCITPSLFICQASVCLLTPVSTTLRSASSPASHPTIPFSGYFWVQCFQGTKIYQGFPWEINKYHWTEASFHLLHFMAVNNAAQLESTVRNSAFTCYSWYFVISGAFGRSTENVWLVNVTMETMVLCQWRTSSLLLSVRICYVINNHWMMKMEPVGAS